MVDQATSTPVTGGEPDNLHPERRHYTRHPAELRVQLFADGMLPMQVTTADISMAGWHFECDQWTVEHLRRTKKSDVVAEDKHFTARVKLGNSNDKQKTLTLITNLIDVSDLGEDRYRVNMRFVQYGGRSQDLLGQYLKTL